MELLDDPEGQAVQVPLPETKLRTGQIMDVKRQIHVSQHIRHKHRFASELEVHLWIPFLKGLRVQIKERFGLPSPSHMHLDPTT